jgi:predicted short-subunit dehydrogenase-like oxidoreductase (DUF2520 family)
MAKTSGHPASDLPSLVGKKVAILGAGKVGCAVGVTLGKAGLPIVAVTTRGARTATQAAQLTGADPCTDNPCAAARADIVLITTNDDAIARVASQVAEAGAFRPGQLVIHMSGALRLSVLDPAAQAGARIGVAHPLQSFATYRQAVRDIPGSVFGVTAGPGVAGELEAFVHLLDGRCENVPDDKKTLYHAAAVMASNYLVAVEDMATQLLADAGFDKSSAMEALSPLVRRTLENILEFGTTNALTGPIARGDVDTIRGHLAALEDLPVDRLELYKALGRHTLAIARRRGALADETLAELRDILGADDGG